MGKKKTKREQEGRQLMLNRVDAKLQAMFAKQNSISASQLVQALLSIGYEVQHVDNTVTIQPEYIFKAGDILARGALFRGMPDHPVGVVVPPKPEADPVLIENRGTILIDGIATHDAKKGETVRITISAGTKVEVQAGQGLERAHAAAVAAANVEHRLRQMAHGTQPGVFTPKTPPEVADRLKANHIATVQPRTRHRPKAAKKAPARKR